MLSYASAGLDTASVRRLLCCMSCGRCTLLHALLLSGVGGQALNACNAQANADLLLHNDYVSRC